MNAASTEAKGSKSPKVEESSVLRRIAARRRSSLAGIFPAARRQSCLSSHSSMVSPESSELSYKSESGGRRGGGRRASTRRESITMRITGRRRNSLAPLKMRDIVMLDKFEEVKEAAIAEHATERSWRAIRKVVKAAEAFSKPAPAPAPAKGDTARDESWRRGSLAADPAEIAAWEKRLLAQDDAAAAARQPPEPPKEPDDWEQAAAVLGAAVRSCGCKGFTPQSTPSEAVQCIATLCEPTAFVAHQPATRSIHETADNTTKRHRAQRDPRAAPIVPRPEAESEYIFAKRLDATRSLVDLRSGPQRVLVIPQQPHEVASLAIARLEVQGTCPAIVMPIGANEDHAAFDERLEALRATPRPADGAPRSAPVLPRGRHEGDAAFALRLEVAVLCSAVVLPQAEGEGDEDATRRLEAQRAAPRAFIEPYRPQSETRDAFLARCAPPKPSALGKRPSCERFSGTARQLAAQRLGKSPRRTARAATTGALPAVTAVPVGSRLSAGAGAASARSCRTSGRSGRFTEVQASSQRSSAAKEREGPRSAEKRKGALARVGRSLTRVLSFGKARGAGVLKRSDGLSA